MANIMKLTMEQGLLSKKSIWAGRIISGLVVLFLLFDSTTKVMLVHSVVKASAPLGYTLTDLRSIGLILLVCIIFYLIPKTSVLGTILLTGYFGGAVATNLRIDHSFFSQTLFPVCFGILVWAGLYLRNRQLRNLLPINKNGYSQSNITQ